MIFSFNDKKKYNDDSIVTIALFCKKQQNSGFSSLIIIVFPLKILKTDQREKSLRAKLQTNR